MLGSTTWIYTTSRETIIPQYADLPENWAPAIPNFIIFPSELQYWDTPHFWTKPNKCNVDATIHQLYTYPTNLTKYPQKLICSDCILAKSTKIDNTSKKQVRPYFFQKIKQKSPKYIPHTSSMDRNIYSDVPTRPTPGRIHLARSELDTE
jgi:hypothetical protein